MRLTREYPPNYGAIISVLPAVANRAVIFTYGDTIFAPDIRLPNGEVRRIKLTREIIAHEEIHGDQQLRHSDIKTFTMLDSLLPEAYKGEAAIKAWWKLYLKDPFFRLQQELPAHMTEYQAFVKRHGPASRPSDASAKYLNLVAQKLASPIYGNVVTPALARELILGIAELGDRIHTRLAA